MNKNIFVAVVVALLLAAAFLAAGVIRNINSAKVEAEAHEIKAAPAPAGASEGDYYQSAAGYEKRGELLKARQSYKEIIEKYPSSSAVSKAQESLEGLNIKLLFSPEPTPDSFIYEVQKLDTLTKIAKKFNTTADLITKANNLKDQNVRIGKRLKISKAKFSIAVDKSQNILTLKSDGEIIKTYSVSTGKNSCTPVGMFKITTKIIDPPWYPSRGGMVPSGDPKNVLGSRWLGISKPSYGIHGTIDPGSIGKSVTEGCVRMKNADVEELYVIVPIGTEVVIVD